jgi:hypothetical protein
VSDTEYHGHLPDDPGVALNELIVDLLPLSSSKYYKRDEGTDGPGIIYREKDAADLTTMLVANGGANVFIRKSTEKNKLKPSLCPKSHCPAPFQYSVG